MPTALRIGPYRFYFYSYDSGEPRHMHVDRENMSAKFWLDPLERLRNEWDAFYHSNTRPS
jgi:hypothetical protein